jgi:arylsulfatase A-like enzyme
MTKASDDAPRGRVGRGIADNTLVMWATDNGAACNSWPDGATDETPFFVWHNSTRMHYRPIS